MHKPKPPNNFRSLATRATPPPCFIIASFNFSLDKHIVIFIYFYFRFKLLPTNEVLYETAIYCCCSSTLCSSPAHVCVRTRYRPRHDSWDCHRFERSPGRRGKCDRSRRANGNHSADPNELEWRIPDVRPSLRELQRKDCFPGDDYTGHYRDRPEWQRCHDGERDSQGFQC